MHATKKERYLFICLLVAGAAFLLGLAVAHHRLHEPATSRVNWPSPSAIQH